MTNNDISCLTAISLGGMKQTFRLMEVLQDIYQVHDGLWERMLIRCLPRAGGTFKMHKKSKDYFGGELFWCCYVADIHLLPSSRGRPVTL